MNGTVFCDLKSNDLPVIIIIGEGSRGHDLRKSVSMFHFIFERFFSYGGHPFSNHTKKYAILDLSHLFTLNKPTKLTRSPPGPL